MSKAEIRKKIKEITKEFQAEEIPIIIAAQVEDELVVDALLPGEIGKIDYYNRFTRMLAGSSNFNKSQYK